MRKEASQLWVVYHVSAAVTLISTIRHSAKRSFWIDASRSLAVSSPDTPARARLLRRGARPFLVVRSRGQSVFPESSTAENEKLQRYISTKLTVVLKMITSEQEVNPRDDKPRRRKHLPDSDTSTLSSSLK
jgi:hypothetical protein